MLRRISVLMLGAAALATSACSGDDNLRASVDVVTDTLVAYALTGTPLDYPSGLNTITMTSVPIPPSQSFGIAGFDVGLDINLDNTIQIIPARQLVSALASAPQVGLLALDESFEDVLRAPDAYYRPDTAMSVQIGQTFIIQTFRSSGAFICNYLVTPRVYSKIVIDSVNMTSRAIYLRQTLDPNCGYRSFEPGRPRD